jgi:methylmalonyl-CoA mutase
MTIQAQPALYHPRNKVRFVTAASLFDGHDASINIIRRLLQDRGVEVIHLGHNRSVAEIVNAAIQEDAHAVAVSSYQGGHNEFFRYLVDLLRERGAAHIRVFGGGGGVIVPREIRELESYGVTRIYSPEDGRVLGLSGMIDDMIRSADFALPPVASAGDLGLHPGAAGKLARLLTQAETNGAGLRALPRLEKTGAAPATVVGITGTGGSGKSSLTDELVRRFATDAPDLPIAILPSIPPSARREGRSSATASA